MYGGQRSTTFGLNTAILRNRNAFFKHVLLGAMVVMTNYKKQSFYVVTFEC